MNKSESIKNLAIALAKFQGEVENPTNSRTVSTGKFSYKYAPLDEVLNLIRPLLSKHGLSVIQVPVANDGLVGVSTTLIHESGEYIEFAPILVKMDKVSAQGAGSAITYARRYALSSILGISSEDDDDGNSIEPTTKKEKNNHIRGQSKATDPDKQAIINNSLATNSQLNYINKLVKEKNYSIESMNSYINRTYNKQRFDELTKEEASEIINMLQGLGKQ